MKRLVNVVRLMLSGQFPSLYYSLWIRLRGLDLTLSTLEDLRMDAASAHEHANSGGPVLREVLRSIDIPAGSRILDFGSGKGGATFTLAEFPFESVVGIEMSAGLVATAMTNRKRLRMADRIQFIHRDASQFRDLDDFSHFYLFNPFPERVLRQVQDNILASVSRHPRSVTIIAKYPEGFADPFRDVFPLLKVIRPKFSHPFYVYGLTSALEYNQSHACSTSNALI